jgi:hypothetical protein
MQHLEVSGAVVLYIGRTVSKVYVVCNEINYKVYKIERQIINLVKLPLVNV